MQAQAEPFIVPVCFDSIVVNTKGFDDFES